MNGLKHARRGIGVAETIEALRAQVASWRAAGERVALVPTMGALHEGHLALVRLARASAERVIVSIFVNPTQFAPTEDLDKYPRTFDADCAALDGLADLVFAPAAQVMYPPGECTFIDVEGPARAGLEDAFRPTHFRGVATIVAKLLIVAAPDFATFGEKDYQQLKVVTRMARDLFLPVTILPCETIREADGLALSSRNRYLSAKERADAPTLHAALESCAAALRAGVAADAALDAARARVTQAGFRIDYLALRDAETLGEPTPGAARRLLVAAHLGATRLIDNIAVER
ncbi:MAG: pantoate--beta-alanine ligase [Microvirga sp.]|nr:pantoate--beta-alanine ligase [Microvirga sp.]